MSTDTSPKRVGTRSVQVRTAATAGLFGGVMGASVSALINGTLVGLPSDAVTNTINHGITGLASGFMAGFIGLLVHFRKSAAENSVGVEQV
ncbi:hypothetical protein AB0N88_05200 [Streptomyces sp. NPDC093516]|uniref:hypothetical protein n=1 Tax=Streptomyces sp. NPDC093516 TaxID=3155304 RepID=UPI00342BB143